MPIEGTDATININADERFGTVSIDGIETGIQVAREVDQNGNDTGGYVAASQEDADNLSAALDMDISIDTTLGSSEQVTTDNSTELDQSGTADTGNEPLPAVSDVTVTGSNITGGTGTAIRDDNGEEVFVQLDQDGNVIDVSYEPDFDEPANGIQPVDVDPTPEPTTPAQPPGTNTAPPTQSDAATATTDSMTQSDIGPTALPGTPIGLPTDELTTPPTSVGESNEGGDPGFPVHGSDPGDSVYQSDNDYEIGSSDGGPGVWTSEPTHRGSEYQELVTGAPQGTDYTVEGVRFDGYDPERDVLIDAMDWTDWPSRDSNGVYHDFALDSVIDQAEAQVVAANGTAIEWHVPTPEKAEELREILEAAEITVITVVVTPKP